ncbi:hypothetical protein B0H13DRAFT_2317914 [Mycena leptocephala]|nr:hypothetical protein B0H13DRAFT_2317914 [Mycena leptocephala]
MRLVRLLRKLSIDEENAGRREWVLRRAEIDSELGKLRGGPLAGVRINGRRPAERPLDNAQTAPDASLIENEEDADLSGGVEIETDSSLNFQEPSTPFNTVEPAGTDVTDILHYKREVQFIRWKPNTDSFDISSFLSSSADFLDSNPQFQQPGITDNDLGLNPYIPTEEFLSYLDNPEFLRNLEMGATSSNMEVDLPLLPMPTARRLLLLSPSLLIYLPHILRYRAKERSARENRKSMKLTLSQALVSVPNRVGLLNIYSVFSLRREQIQLICQISAHCAPTTA